MLTVVQLSVVFRPANKTHHFVSSHWTLFLVWLSHIELFSWCVFSHIELFSWCVFSHIELFSWHVFSHIELSSWFIFCHIELFSWCVFRWGQTVTQCGTEWSCNSEFRFSSCFSANTSGHFPRPRQGSLRHWWGFQHRYFQSPCTLCNNRYNSGFLVESGPPQVIWSVSSCHNNKKTPW